MRRIAILLAAVFAFVCAGCADKQRTTVDPLGAAPSDFAIELTILTGPQAPASSEVQLRQSRYVLFADGSLYQGDDLEHAKDGDWLPPMTRVISRRQLAELWSLVQQLGFSIGPPQRTDAVNFKLVQPAPDGVVYLAGFSGWGERWTFERPCSAGETDPAMTQLTRELARLAWATDQPPPSASVMPKRYNFGPDPYVRFRQPPGAPAAGPWPAKVKGAQP